MTVDVSKLREGDAVLMRGKVERFPGFGLGVRLALNVSTALLSDLDIVSVEPRPLKVGDRVQWKHSRCVYEISASDGDAALIRDGTTVWGAMLSDLSPA